MCFKDLVDGKQRLNAIVDFVQDKYTDSFGNYYSDLSEKYKQAKDHVLDDYAKSSLVLCAW